LEHQAQFVTYIHRWLFPLYVLGTFLTMLGTLYGTLEIAPTLLRETLRALARGRKENDAWRTRLIAIGWCTALATILLAINFVYQLEAGDKPAGLTAMLIPVNLFTGVFACGLICLLNPWMDRHLSVAHRMPLALTALNLIGAAAFLLVALRGYWDYARWWAIPILSGMLAIGPVAAWLANRWRNAAD
jgi:hypothetical protein